jgi:hypothetical protein
MRPVTFSALAVLASASAAPAFALPPDIVLGVPRAVLRSPSPTIEEPDVAFKEKLKKAAATGKKSDVEALVRGNTTQTAAWILRLDELLLDRDDPDERALRDGLVAGWNEVVKTEFPVKIEAYLKELGDSQRRTRADLRKRLAQARRDLEGNRDQKSSLVFVQTAEELDVLAGAFETEKDFYSASEAHVVLAMCFDEEMRGTEAEPHKAWKHWTSAVDFRTRIECKDDQLAAAEKRVGELAKTGYDKPPTSDPAPGEKGGETPSEPATPPGETGNAIVIPLTFDTLATPDAFARPCFQADEIYALWNPLPLGPKGSSGTFNRLGAESPVLHRIGSSDLRFDTDHDGKADGPADQKIALTGTFAPFHVQVGKGDDERPWAFFALSGIDKDDFQGIQVNLQATDEAMPIYTLSAASVLGNVAGTPIRIIDDTMDAVYGSDVQTFGYGGLVEGHFQPEMDSIVVGTGKRARPWSQYQEIGGAWWKFELGSKGKQIHATPVKPETGTLKLEAKGLAPLYVVVRGATELKDSYFDLVEGGSKGVTVPVGRYTLFYGDVRKGKKRQVVKALIVPGKGSPNYDVQAGKTTVVSLGAPYGFDFTTKAGDGQVTIVGDSVVVTGVGGERYERAWNCVPRPVASWRKKGTKKASGSEKMPLITDQAELYKRGNDGWLDVWFPLDLVLETKGADSVEVQLADDKNKLFGKVGSAWKE